MLNGTGREDHSEKVRFDPRLGKGGKKGGSHGVSVGKTFHGGRTASAKALGLDPSWQLWVGG